MNAFEKEIAKKRGEAVYRMMIEARKSGNPAFHWWIIFIVCFVRSTILFAAMVAIINPFALYTNSLLFPGLELATLPELLFFCIFCTPFLIAFVTKKSSLASMGLFLTVMNDTRRIVNGSYSLITRVFAKVLEVYCHFLVIGYSACLWVNYKKDFRYLSAVELEMLGEGLSYGRFFWKQANCIYDELSSRYLKKETSSQDEELIISTSFALASSWMYREPRNDDADRQQYRVGIKQIVKDRSQFSDEVIAALGEALKRHV